MSETLQKSDNGQIIANSEKRNSLLLNKKQRLKISKHQSICEFPDDTLNLPKTKPLNIFLNSCGCQEHFGTEGLNKVFDMPINYLFECIFNHSNEFGLNFKKSQRISELNSTEWRTENGIKVRNVQYKIIQNTLIGTKCIKTSETEKITKYVPNSLIILENVSNGDQVYCDHFYILTRYCIVASEPKKTRLIVHSDVVYVKTTISMIKSIIYKTFTNGFSSYIKCLETHLEEEIKNMAAKNLPTNIQVLCFDAKSELTNYSSNSKIIRKDSILSIANKKKNDADSDFTNTNETDLRREKNKIDDQKRTLTNSAESNNNYNDNPNHYIFSINLTISSNTLLRMFLFIILISIMLNFVIYVKLKEIEDIIKSKTLIKAAQKINASLAVI